MEAEAQAVDTLASDMAQSILPQATAYEVVTPVAAGVVEPETGTLIVGTEADAAAGCCFDAGPDFQRCV